MINSYITLYHDPADPADPADITYICKDPPAMICESYIALREIYVLIGVQGACPLEYQPNSSLIYQNNDDTALLHGGDTPLIMQTIWHLFTLKAFHKFALKTIQCSWKILH